MRPGDWRLSQQYVCLSCQQRFKTGCMKNHCVCVCVCDRHQGFSAGRRPGSSAAAARCCALLLPVLRRKPCRCQRQVGLSGLFSFTHISAITHILTQCFYFVLRRAAVADGGLLVRMKYHVYSVLANISAALPCVSNWSSGLPRVTGQYDIIGLEELQ